MPSTGSSRLKYLVTLLLIGALPWDASATSDRIAEPLSQIATCPNGACEPAFHKLYSLAVSLGVISVQALQSEPSGIRSPATLRSKSQQIEDIIALKRSEIQNAQQKRKLHAQSESTGALQNAVPALDSLIKRLNEEIDELQRHLKSTHEDIQEAVQNGSERLKVASTYICEFEKIEGACNQEESGFEELKGIYAKVKADFGDISPAPNCGP